MKRIVIKDPIFFFSFLAVRGDSWGNALKAYERLVKDAAPDSFSREQHPNVKANFTVWGGHKECLLFFKQKTGAGAIGHEVLHAVAYVAEHLRIPLKDETEEFFAYYTEFLTRELVSRLWN